MAKASTKATPQPGIVEIELGVNEVKDLLDGISISVRNGRYTLVLTCPNDDDDTDAADQATVSPIFGGLSV